MYLQAGINSNNPIVDYSYYLESTNIKKDATYGAIRNSGRFALRRRWRITKSLEDYIL